MPEGGCNETTSVYWRGHCDSDGILDLVCGKTDTDEIWTILSSPNCTDTWIAQPSKAACLSAFAVGRNI